MAIPTLSGSYIDETYGRLVQVSGSEYADGFGNPISFGGGPGGAINTIQINKDGSNFTGSANLTFVNNNIQLTGSILMSGSSYISGVDYIDFDTTAVNTAAVGKLYWNDVDGTLELGLKGGTVRSELGQGLVTRVVNKTSPLIDLTSGSYQVVVTSGAQGQRLAVKLAQGNNDANSAGTLGIVAEDIARNQEGFIITVGLLKNRDTTGALQGETWNDGDILYLSPTIAGAITNIKPQAPNHTVIVGYVEYAHQNNGKIYVKIDNGYEIDELHNVKINGVTSGDLLIYSSSVWHNTKQLSGSYGLTGSLSATSFTGSLQGTASWATNALTSSLSLITNTPTASTTHYLLFVSTSAAPAGTITANNLRIDTSNLSYNPNTNTLTVAQVIGNASTATTATSATNVGITDGNFGNVYPTFVTQTSGNAGISIDSTGLTFNTNTNTLTTTNFVGTASLATTASFATTSVTASTADNFTVRGNLIVSGNTTIGDSTTDSITMTAATMSLGGNLNIDSNTLFVDGGTNRIGIGKIPTTTLDINGNTLITGSFNVSGSVLFPTLTTGVTTNVVMQGANGQLFITASSAVGSGISGIETQYTGSQVDSSATTLNFTGSGVIVTGGSGTTTVEIPGPYIINAKILASGGGPIITFDPTLYYSCFIEYHVFLVGNGPTIYASRAGNIRISVPHNFSTLSNENNIPFVENTTEYRTDPSTPTVTTEDIYFKVNYNGTNIELLMYNDNSTYDAQINLQYRLVGFNITP